MFRKMVQDVTPLTHDKIEPHQPPAPSKNKATPASTSAQAASQGRFIEMDYLVEISPNEALFFSRSGVQPKMLSKLKHGQYPINHTIDLHGMTIEQAGGQLHECINTAIAEQWRTLLLIHGRGKGSLANKPVIKQHVNRWLRDTPEVLAFCSAMQRDGGTGALYILLKRQRHTS